MEQLKILIKALCEISSEGGLTDKGDEYLRGLKKAQEIFEQVEAAKIP